MDSRQNDKDFMNDLLEAIKTATHSGQKTLDQTNLDKIMNVCNKSDKCIEHAYNFIIKQMEKKHSEIRYSAFQICDELFRKSHSFRTLVTDNLQNIFQLVGETDLDKPLPLPRARAKELKALCFKTIHFWNELFGSKYKKLDLGYRYLKNCKKIDFSIYGKAENNTMSDKEKRQKIICEERKKKIILEVKDMEHEIRTSVTTLRNCINLVIPEPEEFFIHDKEEIDSKVSSFSSNMFAVEAMEEDEISAKRREVGIACTQHSVQLNIIPCEKIEIEESSENAQILENAKETVKLINNRYLPLITSWIQTLSVVSDSDMNIKNLTDLKNELEIELRKYNNLIIKSKGDEVSTDSEMEEVENEPTSTVNKICLNQDNTLWSIQSENEKLKNDREHVHEDAQPSTSKVDLTERKKKLLPIAPKIPFDVDLYHWEDEHLPTPTILPVNAEGSRFWSSPCEELSELPIPDGSSSLRTRVIEFTGKFEPITHICRAPLKNGKLCPRRDKYKCPFHGDIVPRDETGKCINLEDAEKYAKFVEKQQQENPDWQNPVLLREIKAQTGIDLKMPDKKKKGKRKKKYPGLTDIKSEQNSTNKLHKKIFKRSTMKKIANNLDKMDYKRYRDKYGDSFHYTFDSA